MHTEDDNWEYLEEKLTSTKKVWTKKDSDAAGVQFLESADGGTTGTVLSSSGVEMTVLAGDQLITVKIGSGVKPIVGDVVVVDGSTLKGVLPRQTYIARLRGDRERRSHAGYQQHVIVANVDIAVIVASAASPEFHPRFIDRYLLVCQVGGVKPIIAITKCDLTEMRHPMLDYYKKIGIPVVETSVVTGEGLEELKSIIRGSTVVLVGSSGVGKSSLTNALVPELEVKVGELTTKLGKGRHTTTGSATYEWEPGSRVIDTPGIKSLGVEQLDKASLASYFPEFEPYAGHCKYKNCSHSHEPGCAVKEVAESGELSAFRYESYLRMLAE